MSGSRQYLAGISACP